jgi:hypothetical protein
MLNLILPGLSILAMVGFMARLFNRTRKFEITPSSDEKPEWMRKTPTKETLAATKSKGQVGHVINMTTGRA